MFMHKITFLITWYLSSPGKLPWVSNQLRSLCPDGASPQPPLPSWWLRSLTAEHRGEDRPFPPEFKSSTQERRVWKRCTVCWSPSLFSVWSHFPVFPTHLHLFLPALGELISSPPVCCQLPSPALSFFWGLFPSYSCSLLSFSPFSLRLLPGVVPRARDC